MGKVYGYCRISKPTQDINRQIRSIKNEFKDAVIFDEAFTGRKIEGREKFIKLLNMVKKGDTIVFDSVSRMSRNAEEGFKLYTELFDRGVNLVFQNERYIDTELFASRLQRANVKTGKKYLDEGLKVILMGLAEEQIKIAFEQSQKEVEDLSERTKGGIETARLNGKQIGQQSGRKLEVKKQKQICDLIRKYSQDFDGDLDDVRVMAILKAEKIKIKTGRMVPKHNEDGSTFEGADGKVEKVEEVKEISAKLARNTYYRYKKLMESGEA